MSRAGREASANADAAGASALDALDRRIVNALQGGFPVSARPFAQAARGLGVGEAELIERLKGLRERGFMSRFGPMFDAERFGGEVALAALAAPPERFEAVAELVNAHAEVAHNYAREHRFNMWFVVASDRPGRIAEVIEEISEETGLPALVLPKLEEFFVGLKVRA